MEQKTTHTAPPSGSDEHKLEDLLQGLWDRVHKAGESVERLRSERSALLARIQELERELSRVQQELASRDQLVRSLSEQQNAAGAAEGKILTNGEREALAAKVEELLSRIEGYL